MLNRMDAVLVAGEDCRDLLEPLMNDTSKIFVCPPFIPPILDGPLELPKIVTDFRDKHQSLIVSNAFQISFYHGEDLYGIDMLIELVAELRHTKEMDVGLVFLLPSVNEQEYFQKLQARVVELGITESFLFLTEPLAEACDLWRVADLVIRATNTDGGDSLLVLESLLCGTPAIASDCVPRDPAVTTFRSRDLEDLLDKTESVLLNLDEHKRRLENLPRVNNADKIIDLYEKLENRGRGET